MTLTRLDEIYRDVTQRRVWEMAQRATGDDTSDEAWESYLRFVCSIFGAERPATEPQPRP